MMLSLMVMKETATCGVSVLNVDEMEEHREKKAATGVP